VLERLRFRFTGTKVQILTQKAVQVAHGGLAMYFDSTDISESNKCSQVIPLNAASLKMQESMWGEGAQVSLYLLYWYKSTNTDAEGAADRQGPYECEVVLTSAVLVQKYEY
jgi:hypothetical protein